MYFCLSITEFLYEPMHQIFITFFLKICTDINWNRKWSIIILHQYLTEN